MNRNRCASISIALVAFVLAVALADAASAQRRFRRGPDLAPAAGTTAPDFTLSTLDGTRLDGKAQASLSALVREKPVALLFGSYTWGPFCREAGSLERIHQQYKDDVTFLFVYIREAHPSDDPKRKMRSRHAGKAKEARTAAERHATAAKCIEGLGLTMATVIDDMKDSTSTAYGAFPDRLYVIDRDRKIAFRGERGPFGLDPEAWERGLQRVIASQKSAPQAPAARAR